MSEQENILFSDKLVKPTEDLMFSIIGDRKRLWKEIMDHLHDNYKDTSGNWNWYNDGKRWLFKMTQKKKTIFWSAIIDETFRITFYFGDKAEPLIDTSNLPKVIKDGFKTGKRYGKIRAISLKISDLSDVGSVKELIAIKLKIK